MSLLPSLFQKRTPLTFEDLFDFMSEQTYGNGGSLSSIRIDVKETPVEYIVKADLPGVKKEEVNVSLANQMLTISVEREEKEEEKEADYLLRERRYYSMQRTVPLGFAGAPDSVRAELREGVLEVHVKKSPEKQTKKIPIQ